MYMRQLVIASVKANSPAIVDIKLPPMMLKDRSKMNAKVETPNNAGAGSGKLANRPIFQPAKGMSTNPTATTNLNAKP